MLKCNLVKNWRKLLFSGVMSSILAFNAFSAYKTEAAIYISEGMPSPYVTVANYNSYSSAWVSAISGGISAWNSSSAVSNISVSGSSSCYINVANYGYSCDWYGATSFSPPGVTIPYYTLYFNTLTITRDAPSANFNNFAKGIVAHEYGHVFWLADNPNTGSANGSLMNHNRNRNVVTAPTSYDIMNVNNHY